MIPKPRNNLVGQKFGRWTVLAWKKNERVKGFVWYCRCECGTVRALRATDFRRGHSRSCGCLKNELTVARQTTHNASNTPTYWSWIGMIGRCDDPDNANYPKYGGRGISVCKRWHNFNLFVKDVGLRPTLALTIDRINNSGHYEPGNVRWATHVEQSNNQSSNHVITFNGITESASQAARRFGLLPRLVLERLGAGWSIERSLCEPLNLRVPKPVTSPTA